MNSSPFIIKKGETFTFFQTCESILTSRRSALQPSQIQLIYHRFVWTVLPHNFMIFYAMLMFEETKNLHMSTIFFHPFNFLLYVCVIKFFSGYVPLQYSGGKYRWECFLHHDSCVFAAWGEMGNSEERWKMKYYWHFMYVAIATLTLGICRKKKCIAYHQVSLN